MTDKKSAAEKAYAAAEQLIARAKREGAVVLRLDREETHALEMLPPDIAELDDLRDLDLDNTKISDLTPLSGLTALTHLGLHYTPVSDVTPLSGLSALTQLWLDNTQVSDVTPLSGLTALTSLGLGGTQVADVRPVLNMPLLAENPSICGLTFENCAAARADARIAEISEIADNSERAQVLFAYLQDGWVPPGGMSKLMLRRCCKAQFLRRFGSCWGTCRYLSKIK